MVESVIANLSDTARWVAEYRARETARPDPLFRDPYAAELAGERGRTIAAAAKWTFGNGWFFIARTKLMDELIERSVAEGCDRVINLAAGLDTRPYRLELPADLEWIEVDLGPIIEEKTAVLREQTPRCRLSRVAVDLTDPDARRRCLDEALAGAAKALIITEGLLLYLDEPAVHELLSDLDRPEIAWWIADIIGPIVVQLSGKPALQGKLKNAPVTFGPSDGIGFFERHGWIVDSSSSQLAAAARWNRLSRFMRLLSRLPEPNPRRPGRAPWSAVMRLRH